MAARCGVCAFGSALSQKQHTASYALVVGSGSPRVDVAMRQAEIDAELGVVSGATAFCVVCERVTWLAWDNEVVPALLSFRDRWTAMRLMQAMVFPAMHNPVLLHAAEFDVSGECDAQQEGLS